MKKYIATFILFLLILYSTPYSKVSVIEPQLQWNRYINQKSNFEILSIDDAKGRYLNVNVDSIKSWLITRWGFPNNSFPVKCKLIVVPTQDMFKEFFGKASPQFKVTNQEMNIWIASDDPRWDTSILAKVMTEVCLQSLETKHQVKLPLWVHKGMPVVNGDLPTLRQTIANLNIIFQKDLKVYWSKEILNMTPEILAKHPTDYSQWFEGESAAMLLMLYKQFGPSKFNLFLAQCRVNTPDAALLNVYGFKSYDDCDVAFKNFMLGISSDIIGKGKQVPTNSALTWPIP